MKYTIHIDNKPIVLSHDTIDDTIDVDDLTKIDTSNIYGEAVTISAAANRIGLMRAELESRMGESKLNIKIYEADFKSKKRKEAANNSGFFFLKVDDEDVKVKLSEASLSSSFENDENWINLKKEFIKCERNFNFLSSLYWAIQDKSRKLNGLTSGTTPKEFVEELIEGKINGLFITKK